MTAHLTASTGAIDAGCEIHPLNGDLEPWLLWDIPSNPLSWKCLRTSVERLLSYFPLGKTLCAQTHGSWWEGNHPLTQ